MKCDRARGLLSAALDGELEPAESEALDRHLAACPACAAERGRLAAVRTAFRTLTPAAPPRDLAGAVMERIRAGEAGEPGRPAPVPVPTTVRRRRAARLAAALALLTAGLGAAWLARAPEVPAAPAAASRVAVTASRDLGADAGCEADGDCLHLAPCDSPMECGGGEPCSNPGECGGTVD
jgi:anti-sigma factor RsiW